MNKNRKTLAILDAPKRGHNGAPTGHTPEKKKLRFDEEVYEENDEDLSGESCDEARYNYHMIPHE